MNILKIQQDVLKALLKDERVGHCKLKDGRVLITTCGAVAHIIPEADLHLRLDSRPEATSLRGLVDVAATYYAEHELTPTDNYIRAGKVREYIRNFDDVITYIDVANLKNFDKDAKLYQRGNNLAPVTVSERLPLEKEPSVVGVVMPMNINK